MGLFDIFKGGGARAANPLRDSAKPTAAATAAAKWAEKAADRRAQKLRSGRRPSAALAEMGTAEAVAALLKRFTFTMDPSITDQEEKDGAYNAS